MNISKYIDFNGSQGISGLFSAIGDFGTIDGREEYNKSEENGIKKFVYSYNGIKVTSELTEYGNGVIIRRDYFENLTDKEIVVNKLSSRFRLYGNDYDVYTQFNGWQHESSGGWQKLVTGITAQSQGIRTCDGATPMMGLKDVVSGKTTVFQLFPNCQWKITARKEPVNSEYETVIVEAGINDSGLKMSVRAGEKIELPAIAFYIADNPTDLGAYKLHEIYNELYPRREMPVIYNSWLYDFGNIDVDGLFRQIDCAAEMGIEAFMIDAGWFGNGSGWWEQTGDWTENLTFGPKGRLIEISRRVREKGMKFGLWFEPERGGTDSELMKTHPEYFFGGRFFDFSLPNARKYMADRISEVIDKYSVEWIKLDFNATISYDETGNSFYRYMQGQKEFILDLKRRYPDLYITNCASGGYRMELVQGTITDSFWLSDNQGPKEGVRIVKDTIKRLPPQLIERWTVQKYAEGFLKYGSTERNGIMLDCNDATWTSIATVSDGYKKAFMTGGPMGFSCDIASFPDEYKKKWRDAIAEFKKNRDFYLNASARLLADTEEITVVEYSDKNFERCVIQIFTNGTHSNDITVYPALEKYAVYETDGKEISGKELAEDGITIENVRRDDCIEIELRRKRHE